MQVKLMKSEQGEQQRKEKEGEVLRTWHGQFPIPVRGISAHPGDHNIAARWSRDHFFLQHPVLLTPNPASPQPAFLSSPPFFTSLPFHPLFSHHYPFFSHHYPLFSHSSRHRTEPERKRRTTISGGKQRPWTSSPPGRNKVRGTISHFALHVHFSLCRPS